MNSFVSISLAAAMEEVSIESSTTCSLIDILTTFEKDIAESDRELDDALQFAESLLHRQNREHRYVSSSHIEGGDDSSRGTEVSALTEPHFAPAVTSPQPSIHEKNPRCGPPNAAQLQQTASVTPTFALDVAKLLGGQCPISMDGATAKVPVGCLLEALQQLMAEREEFLHETLELMAIARRTTNMAMDMKLNEDLPNMSSD